MIGNADEDGVQQTAFAGRGQPLVMQQEDVIGERRLPHQVEDVMSPDSDVVRAGVDDWVRHVSIQVVGYYVRAGAGGVVLR